MKGYVLKGINVKESLYKKIKSKLHRQELTLYSWLEKKMIEELGDELDDMEWLDLVTPKTHTGGQNEQDGN